MPRAKPRAVDLSGGATDLETGFYEALQLGDIDKLMACWADEDDILCIHPGGSRLIGAGAIRTAYEALFAQAGAVNVQAQRLRKIESMGCEIHSVVERLTVMVPEGPQEVFLLATNVYHKTAQGWRMVVHHVSPGSVQDIADATDAPQVLH